MDGREACHGPRTRRAFVRRFISAPSLLRRVERHWARSGSLDPMMGESTGPRLVEVAKGCRDRTGEAVTGDVMALGFDPDQAAFADQGAGHDLAPGHDHGLDLDRRPHTEGVTKVPACRHRHEARQKRDELEAPRRMERTDDEWVEVHELFASVTRLRDGLEPRSEWRAAFDAREMVCRPQRADPRLDGPRQPNGDGSGLRAIVLPLGFEQLEMNRHGFSVRRASSRRT